MNYQISPYAAPGMIPKKQSMPEDLAVFLNDALGLAPGQIFRKAQKGEIVEARQICCYIGMRACKFKGPALARLFRQDHTTVYHGVTAIKNRMDTEPEYEKKIEGLTMQIKILFMGINNHVDGTEI